MFVNEGGFFEQVPIGHVRVQDFVFSHEHRKQMVSVYTHIYIHRNVFDIVSYVSLRMRTKLVIL